MMKCLHKLRAWLLPVHTNSQVGDLACFPRPKSSSCQR